MNRRNPNRHNQLQTDFSNMNLQRKQEHASRPQQNPLMFPQKQHPVSDRSGICVLCKTVTVLVCQRCGDFYCSPNCQTKDWPKHRYICFQMPPLIHSSSRLTQDMPSLNGYQRNELPPTASVGGSPKTPQRLSPAPMQPPQPEMSQNNGRLNVGKIEQARFPANNSSVLLTTFRSSNRIFIRSIESKENTEYCEVIRKINECGKTAVPLKSMPSRNSFAITDFNNDNLFYRVQIVSAKNENEIKVIYYDFGNEATKKLSELKAISRDCVQLKQYIMLVSLKNVPHVRDNDKLNEYLKSFEETEATIRYQEKEKPACEIIPWGVEESINTKINLYINLLKDKVTNEQKQLPKTVEEKRTQQSPAQDVGKLAVKPDLSFPKKPSNESVGSDVSKKYPSQLAKPVKKPPFETVHLPVGQKNLDIMVVDNSLVLFGYFGCVLCSDKENLQHIQKYLSEFEDNGRPYKPQIDEYCLAKFEGCWYRAKVLNILSEEYVEVVFIDFLNESQVSVKSIQRYPMDLEYPCKTTLCMIDDLPSELSDDIVDILKEKLQPGSEHRISEVKGVDEDAPDVFVVKMNQVPKWLNE